MIGNIITLKYFGYGEDIYFKILDIYDYAYRCKCIKSHINVYQMGRQYVIHKECVTKEMSEYDFNKIMVFE